MVTVLTILAFIVLLSLAIVLALPWWTFVILGLAFLWKKRYAIKEEIRKLKE